MMDSNDNNAQPEAKKWREFWVHNSRDFGPITLPHGLLFASDKPNELIVNHEVIKCVESGALNELKAEKDRLTEEVQRLTKELETVDRENSIAERRLHGDTSALSLIFGYFCIWLMIGTVASCTGVLK